MQKKKERERNYAKKETTQFFKIIVLSCSQKKHTLYLGERATKVIADDGLS